MLYLCCRSVPSGNLDPGGARRPFFPPQSQQTWRRQAQQFQAMVCDRKSGEGCTPLRTGRWPSAAIPSKDELLRWSLSHHRACVSCQGGPGCWFGNDERPRHGGAIHLSSGQPALEHAAGDQWLAQLVSRDGTRGLVDRCRPDGGGQVFCPIAGGVGCGTPVPHRNVPRRDKCCSTLTYGWGGSSCYLGHQAAEDLQRRVERTKTTSFCSIPGGLAKPP